MMEINKETIKQSPLLILVDLFFLFSYFSLEQDAFLLHIETPSHFASVSLNSSTVDIYKTKKVKIIIRLKKINCEN